MTRVTKSRGRSIGDAARHSGVNIETIRYYERAGVLPKPERTAGGTRVYSDEQLQRLVFVRRSRELGFGLEEIRELLALVDTRDYTCGEVNVIATSHLDSVRRKLADLRKLERTLSLMVSECSRGEVPDCPIIEALSSPPAGSQHVL